MEEFERAKVVLERDDTSVDLKISTLKSLQMKNPSKEVLIKTELGKIIF